MSLATRHNHPEASHQAEARIRAAGGDGPLGASPELIAYVRGFVTGRTEPFTSRQVVLAIWRKEFMDGRTEDEITCDSSIRRGLDAMRKAKEIEKVEVGPRGQVWRVVRN